MVLKLFLGAIYTLVLTLGMASTANALLLYSSPDFNDSLNSGAGRISDTDWFGNDTKTAAGFSLSGDSKYGLIKNVSFGGTDDRYFDSLSFTIRFYSETGGQPESNAFYEYNTIAYTTSSSSSLSSELFSVDISPVLLDTTETYYFSVQADSPSSTTWGWNAVFDSTNTYDTFWIDDRFSDWQKEAPNTGMGFQLYGHPVPEPSVFWLLSLGLLSFTILHRRRKS